MIDYGRCLGCSEGCAEAELSRSIYDPDDTIIPSPIACYTRPDESRGAGKRCCDSCSCYAVLSIFLLIYPPSSSLLTCCIVPYELGNLVLGLGVLGTGKEGTHSLCLMALLIDDFLISFLLAVW